MADGKVTIDTRLDTSGLEKGIKGVDGKLQGLKTTILDLAKVATAAFAAFGLVEFGKQAIELGSNVAEVQNVVDVSFEDMSYKVEAFADSAIQNFGMSELAAKKTASTYMAMARGMGVAMDSASEMSIQLAGLSGDVASFYNISQEEAAYKLQSVFTGETESLKELGIVMTQTNLQQYAMAKGMNSNIQAMTQSEQVALRYAYVTEQLSLASGDFLRTQDSWANQTRILQMQWQQFMSVIGQTLIQVLTPALQFLNQFVAQLVQWATTVNSIISSLFGGDAGAAGAGSAAMAGAAASAGNLAGSTEDAAAAQEDLASSAAGANEELKNQIQNFSGLDEISTFATQKAASAAGGAGAGAGIGGITADDISGITSVQDQIKGATSEIEKLIKSQDWAGLGAYIATGINTGLQKIYDVINWDTVRPKVEPFIVGFSQAFNSLVYNVDWNLMGRTVGAGINTVVGTLVLAIKSIDWVSIGVAFGEGVNGIFEEVDWENLGTLIGSKFMLAWQVFYGFVTTLDWTQVGSAIATALNGAIENMDLGLIASSISTFVIGLLTAFTTAVQETDWTAVGQQIGDALAAIDWFGIGQGLFGAGVALLNGLLEAFQGLPAPVQAASIAVGIFMALWKGTEIATFIINAGGLVGAFGKITSAVKSSTIAKLADKAVDLQLIALYAKDFVVSLGKSIVSLVQSTGAWIANTSAKIASTAAEWAQIAATTAWSAICAVAKGATLAFGAAIQFLTSPIGLVIIAIVALIAIVAIFGDEIQKKLEEVDKFLQNVFAKDWKEVFGPVIGEALNAFFANIKNIWNAVKKIFDGIIDFIRGVFTGDWERAWQGIQEIFGGIFDGLLALAKMPLNGIIGLLNMAINGINDLIRGFNGIGFDMPDWLGGGSFHPNIPTIPNIPYLAQGAVLPANKPFLAVVGDQKNGTNVEAPLETIKQAVAEVMARNGKSGGGVYNVNVQVGRKTFLQFVIDEAKMAQVRTGKNPFELA